MRQRIALLIIRTLFLLLLAGLLVWAQQPVNVVNTPTVSATQGTSPWVTSGTVTSNQGGAPWSFVGTLTNNGAAPAATNFGTLPCLANASAPSWTEGRQVLCSVDLAGNTRVVIPGTVTVTMTSTTITGTVAVTQSTSPWVVSCTVANCSTNLGNWGGAALGTPTNFGTTPGAVIAGSVNASLFSGTTALGTPNTFGTTAPTGNALGVNSATFIGTTLAINDGTVGAQGIGGHFADNGVAAATNRVPTLPSIYQTDYLNGTAATQGRNGALSQGTDGLLWVASLPSIRPASYTASASFAGSSTTVAAHLAGNATNTVLVTKIIWTCTQTTAGLLTVTVNKTSAASTGGTAATMTAVPDDSNYAAASSVAQSFTGTGPTAGTPVGQIDAAKVGCGATTSVNNDIYILNLQQKPIVLRGTAQTLEIGVGAAITGGNVTVTWKWIETKTITP